MGMLRVLLAVSIIFYHAMGDYFVGGRNAVQMFYMISGFLISYVLVERKAYSVVSDFYKSRYLRIYPIYFLSALLTLITISLFRDMPLAGHVFATFAAAPASADLVLAFSNLFIFTQDWLFFLGVSHHELIPVASFQSTEVALTSGLLLPQAWSLGVELSFYALAPFIIVRKRVLLAVFLASIAARGYLALIGLANVDPWTYRFFPTELAMFLLGALAHQILLPAYTRFFQDGSLRKLSGMTTYAFLALSCVYFAVPGGNIAKSAIIFAAFFFILPMLFIFQRYNKWDRSFGELSYPVYMVHVLVLQWVEHILAVDGLVLAIVSTISSLWVAHLLNRYVAEPIEAFRNGLKGR